MNLLNLLATNVNPSQTGQHIVDTAYEKFLNIINIIMPVLIGVVLVFGLVYGIILGIQFAKAEDTEGRDKAKQRLINVIIGVLVAAIIIGVIYAILGGNTIKKYFDSKKLSGTSGGGTTVVD